MNIGSSRIYMNKIWCTVILFSASVSMTAYGQSFVVRPLGTTVEGGRHYLHMQVVNCTSSNIEVHLADLPWGQHTLGLVLYPAGKLAGEPLKENIPLADVSDSKVNIKARNFVEGKVDLDSRFIDVSRYERLGSLLVFWEYDLSLVAGGKSQFVGGMIPLNEIYRVKKVSDACL